MKLKFPKTILVGDTRFTIKLDKERTGGEFSYWGEYKDGVAKGGYIIIGTFLLKVNPLQVLNTIIHELQEIICVEQGTRFPVPHHDNAYEFHYNHRQHTELCSRLAGLLEQFIK